MKNLKWKMENLPGSVHHVSSLYRRWACHPALSRLASITLPQRFNQSLNIRFVIEEMSCHANALRLLGDDDLLLCESRNEARWIFCLHQRLRGTRPVVVDSRENLPASAA